MPDAPTVSHRVGLPVDEQGRRSSSALGRGVVADALRVVDPAGAADAERETAWRSGYVDHVRRLTLAGLPDADCALTVARDGLAALERRRQVGPGGTDHDGGEAAGVSDATPLSALRSLPAEARPAHRRRRRDAPSRSGA